MKAPVPIAGTCRSPRVAVFSGTSESDAKASLLAEQLALPVVRHQEAALARTFDLLLAVMPHRLEIREVSPTSSKPLYVDFVFGAFAGRFRHARQEGQLLARAVGLSRTIPMTLIDTTAGLGGDAFLLACLGAQVCAIERCGVLHALLADGLERAGRAIEPWLRQAAARVTLYHDDARRLLGKLIASCAPGAVYLDPMYPQESRSALRRKSLRICRALAGDDPDAADLLAEARKLTTRRVIVKRPLRAPALAPDPDFQYRGRTVRFDVYATGR